MWLCPLVIDKGDNGMRGNHLIHCCVIKNAVQIYESRVIGARITKSVGFPETILNDYLLPKRNILTKFPFTPFCGIGETVLSEASEGVP